MRLMKRGNRTVFLIILSFCLLLPVAGMAAGPECVWIDKTENLTIASGKSLILCSKTPINKFLQADDKKDQPIVNIFPINPNKFYLTGKSPGVTSLTFYEGKNKLSAVFDVEVTPDAPSLKDKLHKVFPDEKNIQVKTSGDSIILSGTVSNAASLSQVLAIAGSYVPSGKKGESDKQKLINLLEVGGVHQVMLEVRISEMSKTLGRKLGVNFSAIGRVGQEGTIGFLSTLVSPVAAIPLLGLASNPVAAAGIPFAGIAGQYIKGDVTWTTMIDAMKERNLIKVLAEPTLITMSGKQANFLAGGEYPVPVPQQNGPITIEYKTFGVGLSFTPTVLGNGRINMQVAPEVSDLDFTNAVYLQGYLVPGLTVRRVSTTVELADGQSFAVAGLLRDDVREGIKKVPLLGDIPILGALFRSSQFQKNETELVIIVTPHIVKPVDMAKQTLPTDQFIEPNDMEFYLLGLEEGLGGNGRTKINDAGSQPPVSGGGGLDGDFGHIIP